MKWRRSDRILDQAARWVVLIDSAAFNAAAAARFQTWIARSPDHRAAFLLTSKTWGHLDVLPKLKAYPAIAALLEAQSNTDHEETQAPAGLLGRRTLILGGGAAAAGACILGYNVLAPGPAEAFETGVGEQRQVTLADGTLVVLNASTRMKARIGDDRREAQLLAGEALFTIAESSAGIFSIVTPSGEIEAASGEILVKLLPKGARVALLSDAARASRRTWIGQAGPVTASANSEILFERDEVAIDAATAEQLARRTLWREGMLAFDDTPLSEAVADVTRQSGVRFVFADPALADLRVGGLVRADDLDAFLALLRNNLAINAERRSGEITLSSTATL